MSFRLPSAVSSFTQQIQNIGHAVAHGKFPGSSDGKFFTNSKRGELQELREDLQSQNKDRRKTAVKRVIANMTLGKDVSALFPEIVNCMQTNSIELKKLVYLYIINYARSQPDLAILAINTFRKDALDTNPLIRALAVRTMGCIRLRQTAEYLIEPVKLALRDKNPYVRKTGPICIAKLFETAEDAVVDHGFVLMLKDMLHDPNPTVLTNAVAALMDIEDKSGGRYMLRFTEANVSTLLTALNDCTEWGQIYILDSLVRYKTQTAQEAEMIIDRVCARLSHVNAAVVMSAVRVILYFMKQAQDQELISSLRQKLAPPLVTLLGSAPEMQYVSLRCLSLLSFYKRDLLHSTDVRIFFCKYQDPLYVKLEKLEVLVRCTDTNNVDMVLNELKEYSQEVDVTFVRKSLRAVGRVALQLNDLNVAAKCVSVILDLIESRVAYTVQESAVVLKNILRKYPNKFESSIAILCNTLEQLEEPEAKAAMVWILGQYADRIDNVLELLESTFLPSFIDEPPVVQLQVLTATVKIFLTYPKQAQSTVSRVLTMCTEESDNPDLRDRAFMYWRLLSADPQEAKSIVMAKPPPIEDLPPQLTQELMERLVSQLGLLSSVFHLPPEVFVSKKRIETVDREQIESDEEGLTAEEVKEAMEMSPPPPKSFDDDDFAEPAGRKNVDHEQHEQTSSTSSHEEESGFKPPMATLITPHVPGSRGSAGLGVKGCVGVENGEVQLHMAFFNGSSVPLRDWAVQLNSNSFGFAPKKPLSLPVIQPGNSEETSIPLEPNVLNSNTSPPNPLFLQIAIRTNIDIFYMNCTFGFSVVLMKSDPISKDSYREHWTRMTEEKQTVVFGESPQPLKSPSVVELLSKHNYALAVERHQETFEALYFSAVTTNNIRILLEVDIQTGHKKGVKLSARSDSPAILPLLTGELSQLLALQQVPSNRV